MSLSILIWQYDNVRHTINFLLHHRINTKLLSYQEKHPPKYTSRVIRTTRIPILRISERHFVSFKRSLYPSGPTKAKQGTKGEEINCVNPPAYKCDSDAWSLQTISNSFIMLGRLYVSCHLPRTRIFPYINYLLSRPALIKIYYCYMVYTTQINSMYYMRRKPWKFKLQSKTIFV